MGGAGTRGRDLIVAACLRARRCGRSAVRVVAVSAVAAAAVAGGATASATTRTRSGPAPIVVASSSSGTTTASAGISIAFGARGPQSFAGAKWVNLGMDGLALVAKVAGTDIQTAGMKFGCNGPGPTYDRDPVLFWDDLPDSAGVYQIGVPAGFPSAPGFTRPYTQCWLQVFATGGIVNGSFSSVAVEVYADGTAVTHPKPVATTFAGTWKGTYSLVVATSGSCGTLAPVTGPATFTLSQRGARVTGKVVLPDSVIYWNSSCHVYKRTSVNDTWTLTLARSGNYALGGGVALSLLSGTSLGGSADNGHGGSYTFKATRA